ncbi:MAG TPA: T9SS type A sorting domain-containing protein, partial [Saprospiraceae bacterium]|nr:T9SS type A sorting domain-containing protein [Saprospiraceae bacterium]
FESSIDGTNFTEIQRGSSNICILNLPIGSILYIRVKVTSKLNNIFKYNTIFKRFQSRCPIVSVPLPGRTIQSTTDLDISIYPNPVSDEIMINSKLSGEVATHIMIQNTHGQIKKSMRLNLTKSNKINIAEIPNGSYFIIFNTGINQKILNFVKIIE